MDDERLQAILSKAMTLCSRSEKCTADIRAKMATWGVRDQESADWVITRLKKERFIDDQRFTTFFIRDKLKFNRWGKLKIRQALAAKKIAATVIKDALDSIDSNEYYAILKAEMESKKNRTKAVNQFDLKGKLFRFGQSRGYEHDLIYRIIDEIS